MRRVLTLAALLGATACDLVRDPLLITDPQGAVMVHAMLRADVHDAKVLITRTADEQWPGEMNSPLPVEGALVHLVHGADTLQLLPQGAGDEPCWADSFSPLTDLTGACYVGDIPFGVVPGEEYRLHATLPDGTLVTGRVTVPSAPAIIAPVDSTHVRESSAPEDAVLVRWAHAADPHLQLVFDSDDPECLTGLAEPGYQSGFTLMTTVSGRDSISVNLHSSCHPQKEQIEGNLILTAYDPGYGRYVRDASSNDWTSLSSAAVNIEGALGVFAASASHAVPVVLAIP